MNSELQRLIDTLNKYNAPFWIIFKGREKLEYYEGSDLLTSISELEIAFEGLEDGEYTFKAREQKNGYNSQLVRSFVKGYNPKTRNNQNTMDVQALINFTQTLAEIKIRQEQMHNEILTISKAVLDLNDKDKSNDESALDMLETVSKGAKVFGSLKDMFSKPQ